MPRSAIGLVLLALVFLPCPRAGADALPATLEYHRDFGGPGAVLAHVRNLAIRRGAHRIVLVFDGITFDPPPPPTEFTESHDYRSDLPGWLDAIEAFEPGKGRSLHVATTLSAKPADSAGPGWRERVESSLGTEWWARHDFFAFEPAHAWIRRLLGSVPGRRTMLVLVTGDVLPEQWADYSPGLLGAASWRDRLRKIGDYWDEERVAAAVRRAGATLDVVAPEARFGDFLPFTDIPEAPWASRPRLVLPRAPAEGFEAALPSLEDLVEKLRRLHPTASEEELREMAKSLRDDLAKRVRERPWGRRFRSTTPLFYPSYGSFNFFNNDVPSRFGYWPFARAAAATGGAFLFYPFPPAEFLDVCPYDRNLLRQFAPEVDRRSDFLAARSNDPALDALCRASCLVVEPTPWEDGFSRRIGGQPASGWFAFVSAKPLRMQPRYRERNKPYDAPGRGSGTVREWKEYGRGLTNLLPLYDRAIGILAAAELDAGPQAHRRSLANLRLARFWFEMSAFHLHALSLYLSELEKHVAPEVLEKRGELVITYVPTIRMSDCLSGYEGRSIPVPEDRALQRGPRRPDGQGNLLPLAEDDPRYRALRHPGEVLKYLDPRLLSRAIRMIDAGADVLRREGRSPWGWMVYYSEACTFIFEPLPELSGLRDRPGLPPEPDPDAPSTPRPKPRARGPSTGG